MRRATSCTQVSMTRTQRKKRTVWFVFFFACGLPRLVASETSVIAKRGEFTRQSGASTQTNSADALLCYAQTLRVDCFAMSASHGKCKCCALALSVARSQSDEVRVAHKCAVRLLSHANLG